MHKVMKNERRSNLTEHLPGLKGNLSTTVCDQFIFHHLDNANKPDNVGGIRYKYHCKCHVQVFNTRSKSGIFKHPCIFCLLFQLQSFLAI